MNVAFIGLGNMGRGMAHNVIKAGHDVVVHDLSTSAAESLVAAGASWAATAAEAVRAAEVVLTSLPGPAEVQQLVHGAGGIFDEVPEGATFFDLSTNSPAAVRKLHKEFLQRGVQFLDAPVSGGPKGAQDGTLTVWVGGEESAFKRDGAVLEAFSPRPFYAGASGAGAIVKLVHNLAVFEVSAVLGEVFALGVRAGIEPAPLFQAVRQGSSGHQFEALLKKYLPATFDEVGMALSLAQKDVRLAVEMARDFAVPTPIGDTVLADMSEGLAAGNGARDRWIVLALQAERAGVRVQLGDDDLASLQN